MQLLLCLLPPIFTVEETLSMIQYAGLGVAMANAQEIVRQNADYITLSNEEDGVAAVVEKFIL